MTLWLGMQHRALGPNKVYSNDDLWLTLTFIRLGQIRLISDFKDFLFLSLATNGQSDKAFLLTSKFCPQCPCPGAIYMYKIIQQMCKKSDSTEFFFKTCNK